MKFLFWLVFLSGVACGPVYYVHQRYFASGERRTLLVRDHKPGGGYRWATPVTIALDPSMNPIAFDLKPRYDLPETVGAAFEETHHLRLSLANDAIWEKEWRMGSVKRSPDDDLNRKARWILALLGEGRSSSDSRTVVGGYRQIHDERVATFSVTQAGDYEFNMRAIEPRLTRIRLMRLHVTANVAEPDSALVILGVVLIIGSTIALIRTNWLPYRRRRKSSD